MAHAFDPARRPQLVLAPAVLLALHAALERRLGAGGVPLLQEAGFATGVAHAESFGDWLAERGDGAARTLPLATFAERLATFFRELGWGELRLRPDVGATTIVDARRWVEWRPRPAGTPPWCHFSTGLLAGFFGTLAGHPLAVLEVEPDDPEACRFLVGNERVLHEVYERLQREMAGAAPGA